MVALFKTVAFVFLYYLGQLPFVGRWVVMVLTSSSCNLVSIADKYQPYSFLLSISNLYWMGSSIGISISNFIGWDPINHLIIYNLASKTEIFQLGRHTLQGLKYIHHTTINKRKIFRLGRHTHQGLKYVSNILSFLFFYFLFYFRFSYFL